MNWDHFQSKVTLGPNFLRMERKNHRKHLGFSSKDEKVTPSLHHAEKVGGTAGNKAAAPAGLAWTSDNGMDQLRLPPKVMVQIDVGCNDESCVCSARSPLDVEPVQGRKQAYPIPQAQSVPLRF